MGQVQGLKHISTNLSERSHDQLCTFYQEMTKNV